MCGICGELRFDGERADSSAVSRMLDKIARRGPGHAGRFSEGALAYGHRRLAIIDLTADGNQPMIDEELAMNGLNSQPKCSPNSSMAENSLTRSFPAVLCEMP